MKSILHLLLVVVFALPSCTGVVQETSKTESTTNAIYVKLSPTEFKKAFAKEKDVQLIDVRTPKEFISGSIPNAINCNILDGSLQKHINKLDKNKTVYVFCAVGGRSGKASKLLQNQGFRKIVDLKGGYNAWSTKQQ